MQGSRGVEDQGVHRGFEIAPEWFGKLPVARHPAPQRVYGDQSAVVVERESLREISGPQGTHRKGFGSPTVQGSGGVEDLAVHHVLARPADGQRQSPLRAVQPVLQDAGQGGVRGKKVRQLVEHDRPLPAGPLGLRGQPCQERAPVRVLDVGKAGEPLGRPPRPDSAAAPAARTGRPPRRGRRDAGTIR